MKKTISVLLSLIMLLAFMPVTAQAATVPVIDSSSLSVKISGNKTEATIGDTVTISVKITGEVTLNRASIWLYDPDNQTTTLPTGTMTLNTSTNLYEYTMDVESATLSGVWKVYHIMATKGLNTADIYNSKCTSETPKADLSAGNFTVSGTGGDVTGPTVDTANFKATLPDGQSTVAPGDVVKLSVKVTDDSSVSSVKVNYLAPESIQPIPYDLSYNSETQKYEYLIPITTTMAAGEWNVAAIEATDEYNNTTRIVNSGVSAESLSGYLGGLSGYLGGNTTADLSAGKFTVSNGSGEEGDKTDPVIDTSTLGRTITGNKAKAVSGDTVTLFVNVTDESQIMTVTALLESPSDKTADNKIVDMAYNIDNKRYEATFTVDDSTPLGVWQVSSITAVDRYVNTATVYNKALNSTPQLTADMSAADFEVVAPHVHSYSTVVTKPTCTAKGYTTHTCSCGDTYKDTYVNALGHKSDKGTVTKKPTYTATGVKTYKCTVCKKVLKTETVAKLPKKTNTLAASGKTVNIKLANLKKKNQTVDTKKAYTIKNAQGTVTYQKSGGNKKITVAKNGKITVKKGLKKGKYTVSVNVTAAGNTQYKAVTKPVKVVINVK